NPFARASSRACACSSVPSNFMRIFSSAPRTLAALKNAPAPTAGSKTLRFPSRSTYATMACATQGGVQNCPFSRNASRAGPLAGSFAVAFIARHFSRAEAKAPSLKFSEAVLGTVALWRLIFLTFYSRSNHLADRFSLPYRQVHLDFHTGPWISDVGIDF